MTRKSMFLVFGLLGLAGCNALPGLVGDTGEGVLDSYFAVNVGREAGHAEALAQLCPSLTYNADEIELNRVAICQGLGAADDCTLPTMDSEKQSSFDKTMASLKGVAPAQVCADARGEAEVDPTLAKYWQ